MGNVGLSNAKKAKQDEFYTQLSDIENELKYYKAQLRGKTILCNCDDPFESNFFRYFALNFNMLGLKKLIATSYVKSPIAGGQLPLLDIEGLKPDGKEPYAIEIKEVPDHKRRGATDLADVEYLLKRNANTSRPLKGNDIYDAGDFRSRECVELLKQADIVITNPPFSLFREYLAQLIAHDKQFLVIGNKNALHYKEIFNFIKENKLWPGVRPFSGGMWFLADYMGKYEKVVDGVKLINVPAIWLTNMDNPKRHEQLPLYKKYSPAQYPKYDNYDAIEVGQTAEIPCDYDGLMGVPDAFLDKFNPEQFELIGIPFGNLGKEIGVKKNYRGRTDIAITKDGKSRCPYSRIIIRRIVARTRKD
ncbi:MAG: adenine-specific methyltransferase EcoRI family protein [Elusimicrobia bacterium]|nr:adenine-specific methyltransferase EcoRI family protein [Elusimicrobiota bacterium]